MSPSGEQDIVMGRTGYVWQEYASSTYVYTPNLVELVKSQQTLSALYDATKASGWGGDGSCPTPRCRSWLFVAAALPPNVGLPPKSAEIGQPERKPLAGCAPLHRASWEGVLGTSVGVIASGLRDTRSRSSGGAKLRKLHA